MEVEEEQVGIGIRGGKGFLKVPLIEGLSVAVVVDLSSGESCCR